MHSSFFGNLKKLFLYIGSINITHFLRSYRGKSAFFKKSEIELEDIFYYKNPKTDNLFVIF